MSAVPTTPFTTVSTDNKHSFTFNLEDSITTPQEIQLEKYQSIVINDLHRNVKDLYRQLEKKKTLLNETRVINMFNLEHVAKLRKEREVMSEQVKEEMRKAKEEMEKLEKKVEEHQEAIKILIEERFKEEVKPMEQAVEEPIVEEPIVEDEPVAEEDYVEDQGSNYLVSDSPSWSNGLFGPVQHFTRNGLTVYGYQGPQTDLEAYNFGITTNLARYAVGFKQRPVNYYSQPARKFRF